MQTWQNKVNNLKDRTQIQKNNKNITTPKNYSISISNTDHNTTAVCSFAKKGGKKPLKYLAQREFKKIF